MTKIEKIQAAHTARVEEVENYQINIDNYTMALEEIDAKPESERAEYAQFRQQLAGLLASEKREQSKSKIMLSVLERQIAQAS